MEGNHPYQERKNSYFEMRRAYMEAYGEPFPRITFNLDDRGSSTWPHTKEHSMCYRKDEPWRRAFAGPDWTFCHWPSSGVNDSPTTFREIAEAGELAPLSDKVAWFGNIESAGTNLPESRTRPMLVNDLAPKHPDKFDFQRAGYKGASSGVYVSMPEMVRKYRYLLDIGGAGYSGRLKFLLFSGRPLFLVDRMYVEYFHDDLEPFVHFIPVSSDLSDLLERHQWTLENDELARRIAQNAKEYATKNITTEKAIERLRQVFKNFSEAGAS